LEILQVLSINIYHAVAVPLALNCLKDSGRTMEFVENVILTSITKENAMKEFKQKNSNKNLKNSKDSVN
jgi:hypothetical protein